MTLLSDAKTVLRITNSAYDTEIEDLIASAQADLEQSGITFEAVNGSSPTIKQALMTYVKANFGYDNKDADRFNKIYEDLKTRLCIRQEDGYFSIVFSVLFGSAGVRQATVTLDGESQKTGEAGTVTFYRKAGNNYKYTVTADGYVSDEDDANLVDIINSSESVIVNLTVV